MQYQNSGFGSVSVVYERVYEYAHNNTQSYCFSRAFENYFSRKRKEIVVLVRFLLSWVFNFEGGVAENLCVSKDYPPYVLHLGDDGVGKETARRIHSSLSLSEVFVRNKDLSFMQ